MYTAGECGCVFLEADVLILELKDFYTRYANDVIATVAFGIGVDSLTQPTNEFYVMGQDLTHMGIFRALKWLAVLSMPKLVQVSTVIILALVKTGRSDNIGVMYSSILKPVITGSSPLPFPLHILHQQHEWTKQTCQSIAKAAIYPFVARQCEIAM
jgi:hypothetical protein